MSVKPAFKCQRTVLSSEFKDLYVNYRLDILMGGGRIQACTCREHGGHCPQMKNSALFCPPMESVTWRFI